MDNLQYKLRFQNYNPIGIDNSGQYGHIGGGDKVTGPFYRSHCKGVRWNIICVCWNNCDIDGGDWVGSAISGDGN